MGRMGILCLPAGVAALFAAASAHAQQPPAGAARLIAQWGREVVEDNCSGGGFRATGTPAKVVFRVDFNADRVPDYVLAPGFDCTMDGEPAYAIFGPQVPWALVLSSGGDAHGSGWKLLRFRNSEAHEPVVRQVGGHPALILSDAGPGLRQPAYATYAWAAFQGTGGMTAVAWFDADGRRINKDGTALGAVRDGGDVAVPVE
jgi:hypothetical protein